MLLKPSNILLYSKAIDMRKQIDGLSILISTLNKSPVEGIYIFYNRNFDKVKLLYFDEGGFCLFYKRLEKGRFTIPNQEEEFYQITASQLGYLLDGLDFSKLPKKRVRKYKIFY